MIIPGKGTIVGAAVVLQSPMGFATTRALRLTNLTTQVILLTNVNDTTQSQEYLMPGQQQVYPSVDASSNPTAVPAAGSTSALADVQAGLWVEWSTEPNNDFLGQYPTSVRVITTP